VDRRNGVDCLEKINISFSCRESKTIYHLVRSLIAIPSNLIRFLTVAKYKSKFQIFGTLNFSW
jgi:hypothetical protein